MLLVQSVRRGKTKGYREHPQRERFKSHPATLTAISLYLQAVAAEADLRGYAFDKGKIKPPRDGATLTVTSGQLAYEWVHLLAKLKLRNPALYEQYLAFAVPQSHPLFSVRAGDIEPWERQ